MPNLKTTIGNIKYKVESMDRFNILVEALGSVSPDCEVTLLQVFEINGVEDAYSFLNAFDKKEYICLMADVLESVSDFIVKCYGDDGIADHISAMRKYGSGDIDYEEYQTLSRKYESSIKVVFKHEDCGSVTHGENEPLVVGPYLAAKRAAEWAEYDSGKSESYDSQWEINERLMVEFIAS